MRILLLPDELKALTKKATSLWEEYREAWKRAGEACTQSSETWHDNFEFDDANRAMQLASKKLWEIQKILNNTQVVSQVIDNKIVNVGKKVKLCINGWEEREYIIGGYHTTIEWRVGYSAPLIQPLLWKTEGETIEILLHGKKQKIEVLEVSVGVDL
jgi:transcription elongation GreA/GreB family factor